MFVKILELGNMDVIDSDILCGHITLTYNYDPEVHFLPMIDKLLEDPNSVRPWQQEQSAYFESTENLDKFMKSFYHLSIKKAQIKESFRKYMLTNAKKMEEEGYDGWKQWHYDKINDTIWVNNISLS